MKLNHSLWCLVSAAVLGLPAGHASAQSSDGAYKILDTTQVMGTGGIDYVYTENDGRRVYVPRGNQTYVFDLDTHKLIGAITNISGHGVAVDPESHHGFCSGRTVGMFDTETMQPIKNIEVQGRPDGILFEPLTKRVYVLSHEAPNVTVIDPKDGGIVGTIDLGGEPEQAASDGKGNLYVDLENKDSIAVVDVNKLALTATYSLNGKGGGPGGLGLDAKNHVLFAMCHDPATCVILSADDGKILTTLPIGKGTDGGGFNPNTMEAFSSQGDGTLTIIKENSPTSFEVAQTVQTKRGCKTCSLDSKNNHIVTICVERPPQPAPSNPATNAPAAGMEQGGGRRGGRNNGPGMLNLIVVGR
jgi:DNA-binding beta-propeller fold protein YncE